MILEKIYSKIYHRFNSGTLTGEDLRDLREDDTVYQRKKKEAELLKEITDSGH